MPPDAASTADDTAERILEATYSALCTHGYAELTMQDIAAEAEISKAALHYHYDTKEELLLAFLEHLYDRFTAKYADPEGDHAVARLVHFVDGVLCRTDPERAEAFQTAFLEIQAQAPYVEAYREELARVDAFVREEIEAILRAGIEEGTVRADVDPEDAAAFIATLIAGVNNRRISIGDTGGGTRRTFIEYVRERVVAPDADVRVDS